MAHPRPSYLDDNIEPDLLAEMAATDPRRKPPMTLARATTLAGRLGVSAEQVLQVDREARANWDASEDPEGYWWSDEDVQAILEASPAYGMSAVEMADAGLIDLTHEEALALDRLSRWGGAGAI